MGFARVPGREKIRHTSVQQTSYLGSSPGLRRQDQTGSCTSRCGPQVWHSCEGCRWSAKRSGSAGRWSSWVPAARAAMSPSRDSATQRQVPASMQTVAQPSAAAELVASRQVQVGEPMARRMAMVSVVRGPQSSTPPAHNAYAACSFFHRWWSCACLLQNMEIQPHPRIILHAMHALAVCSPVPLNLVQGSGAATAGAGRRRQAGRRQQHARAGIGAASAASACVRLSSACGGGEALARCPAPPGRLACASTKVSQCPCSTPQCAPVRCTIHRASMITG
jgi:hypothetical protein